MEEYKDENVISFLEHIYKKMYDDIGEHLAYNKRDIVKLLYADLKAFKDGEW